MIHGDCFAVAHPPYEVSCEVTKVYRGQIQSMLASLRATIADFKSGKTRWFTKTRIKDELYGQQLVETQYAMGVTDPVLWNRISSEHIRELEYRAKMNEHEIERLTRLIDNWQPKDIQTVMEEKIRIDKAMREAKAAEKQVKKDEKARKEAAKKAKRDALEAKRAAIKQEFETAFTALAQEPASEARSLKARRLHEKFKRLTFIWWQNLACQDALFTLGIAYQEKGYQDKMYTCYRQFI